MSGRRTHVGGVGVLALAGMMATMVACTPGPEASESAAPTVSGPSTTASPADSVTPSPTLSKSATPSPRSSATPTPRSSAPRSSATPTSAASCAAVPSRLSLRGDRHHGFAFASLDDPGEVTVEGGVASSAAWSTSKVLVVAAYLDTAVDGDPGRVGPANRRLITAALTRSDADAVVAVRAQIAGRPGAAMTAVLRSIGDRSTVAPEQSQGNMAWSPREQVRFMAALAHGKVVSRAASRYLLETMKPIEDHAWGLGTIGATSYKGGWLRADTATRQLGLVDGYAVAIITDAGPAVVQTDGDAAHVQELNRVARTLRDRLAYEKACG